MSVSNPNLVVVSTEAELAEALAAYPQVRVHGANTHATYRRPVDGQPLRVDLRGIVEFSPADQVVVVKGNTPIQELQGALMERGQCLPMVGWSDGYSPLHIGGTVAGGLMMSLPHDLEAECGSWRDWILGATAMLADGTIAKSGSRAVKNVAGYDVHKFLVGSRGALAVLTEVVLRTYPLKSLPTPTVERLCGSPEAESDALWIQRVLPQDYAKAKESGAGLAGRNIPGTSTIVRHTRPEDCFARFPGDWVLRSNCGEENVRIEDPTQARLMRRTKGLFDPADKLNPGEFGIA